MKKILLFFVLATTASFCCNKKFDEPPTSEIETITANFTIRQLREIHAYNNIEAITDDKIISGIVTADDKSGNFYKQITIQDETGGIVIKMDGSNLYTDYPIGRKVFVRLKGLFIGDYNRMLQIGAGKDNSNPAALAVTPIPSILFNKYVVKGSLGNTVEPILVTVDQLTEDFQSMLIKLEDFQFAPADTSKTYGDVSLASSARNFTIKNCAGSSITLRNSSYADFCGIKAASGKGSITAIYSIFGATKQLLIRDTSDIQFTGKRCNSTTLASLNIADLRAMYQTAPVTIPDGKKIKGIVITDKSNGNFEDDKLVIQQGDNLCGIVIHFTAAHNYSCGDEVEINISNLTLDNKNYGLQVCDVPLQNAVKTGTGQITARVTSISELVNNFKNREATLITLPNTTISDKTNKQWNGLLTLTSQDATLRHFALSTAKFVDQPYPQTQLKSITGAALSVNQEQTLMIRNMGDVDSTLPVPVTRADLIISEYIEGSSYNRYLEIYNASSTSADLSKYIVRLYLNGAVKAKSSSKLDTLIRTPSLAPNGIIVIKHPSAKAILPPGVIAYISDVCNFTGNDAITLEKNGTVIDVFGEVGINPGKSWTIAGNDNAAVDKTVRRKSGIVEGNTNWQQSATSEWLIFGKDDVSNLGAR
ncbi:DUF5689 domain-containing protein [Danxiaibacter flavus]|uniref:DUF5689 domain-containing protein n=1 Tax=Danxiaibacter flavus TaxID=3049108 RepID=A0ABV3Z810_9BACT|nr:DUF5689 domain-containing protein [Chitinophagaceae bacterium DXS]